MRITRLSGQRRIAARRAWATSLALIAAAALALGAGSARAQTAAPSKILVGGTPSLLYLPFYVALDLGLFTKEGISVELVTMPNAIPAVLSGEVQFSLSGSDAAVISAARGKPTPAVVMFQQRSTLALVASVAHTLPKKFPDNVRGLTGKTIALNRRGATSENLMKQVFTSAGMQEGRDYSVVIIPTPASIILALKARSADGAILWPPFTEQSEVEKIANLVVRENSADSPEARSKSGGVSLQVNADFLKANPALVRKVIDAISAGSAMIRDYANNEQRLVDVAVKYTGMSNREAMAKAIRTVAEFAYPGIDCESWETGAREMFEVKAIPVAPKCGEMTALDIAPKGPIGPAK